MSHSEYFQGFLVRSKPKRDHKTKLVLRRCNYEKRRLLHRAIETGVVGNGTLIPHPYGRDIVSERVYDSILSSAKAAARNLARPHGRMSICSERIKNFFSRTRGAVRKSRPSIMHQRHDDAASAYLRTIVTRFFSAG
jgi:hypothetical protein